MRPANIDNSVKSRWSKWINIDEYDALLKQHGYESIYSDLFSNKDTSAYGGIVDYIYYKPSKLRLNSSKIYDDKGVMEKTGTKYKPVLSDHFPVVANFTVIKENSIVRPNVTYYVKNPNGSLNKRSTRGNKRSTRGNYYAKQTKHNISQEPRSRKRMPISTHMNLVMKIPQKYGYELPSSAIQNAVIKQNAVNAYNKEFAETHKFTFLNNVPGTSFG